MQLDRSLVGKMKRETKRKCCKTSTVLGAFLMLLPNGVPMYWGNLSVYVNSYIVVCLDAKAGVEDPWVVSMFLLFWTLGAMTYDYATRVFGKRWGALLGAVLINIGYSCTYFSVQHSFVMLNVTLAVLTGIGTGQLQTHGLRLLVDWADDDYGLLVAIFQGAFQVGSSIMNQVVTLYLNPSNALPKVRIDNSVYFTQKDILDKVPSLFLYMTCFSFAFHVLGHFLMSENTFKESDKKTGTGPTEGSEETDKRYGGLDTTTRNGDFNSFQSDTQISETVKNGDPVVEDSSPIKSITKDYTPKEVLKSASFYFLSFVFLFAEYPFLLLANYYKTFGQIWIHDDHFLADLGTVSSFVNIVMRIVWGILMDKIGVRNCLIIELTLIVFISEWNYFAARTNKWLFFFVTIVYYGLSSAMFGCYAVVVVSLYGRKHFSTNYGLLRLSSVLMCLICPFITQALLDNLGWFYVYSAAGLFNLLALILMLFCLKGF